MKKIISLFMVTLIGLLLFSCAEHSESGTYIVIGQNKSARNAETDLANELKDIVLYGHFYSQKEISVLINNEYESEEKEQQYEEYDAAYENVKSSMTQLASWKDFSSANGSKVKVEPGYYCLYLSATLNGITYSSELQTGILIEENKDNAVDFNLIVETVPVKFTVDYSKFPEDLKNAGLDFYFGIQRPNTKNEVYGSFDLIVETDSGSNGYTTDTKVIGSDDDYQKIYLPAGKYTINFNLYSASETQYSGGAAPDDANIEFPEFYGTPVAWATTTLDVNIPRLEDGVDIFDAAAVDIGTIKLVPSTEYTYIYSVQSIPTEETVFEQENKNYLVITNLVPGTAILLLEGATLNLGANTFSFEDYTDSGCAVKIFSLSEDEENPAVTTIENGCIDSHEISISSNADNKILPLNLQNIKILNGGYVDLSSGLLLKEESSFSSKIPFYTGNDEYSEISIFKDNKIINEDVKNYIKIVFTEDEKTDKTQNYYWTKENTLMPYQKLEFDFQKGDITKTKTTVVYGKDENKTALDAYTAAEDGTYVENTYSAINPKGKIFVLSASSDSGAKLFTDGIAYDISVSDEICSMTVIDEETLLLLVKEREEYAIKPLYKKDGEWKTGEAVTITIPVTDTESGSAVVDYFDEPAISYVQENSSEYLYIGGTVKKAKTYPYCIGIVKFDFSKTETEDAINVEFTNKGYCAIYSSATVFSPGVKITDFAYTNGTLYALINDCPIFDSEPALMGYRLSSESVETTSLLYNSRGAVVNLGSPTEFSSKATILLASDGTGFISLGSLKILSSEISLEDTNYGKTVWVNTLTSDESYNKFIGPQRFTSITATELTIFDKGYSWAGENTEETITYKTRAADVTLNLSSNELTFTELEAEEETDVINTYQIADNYNYRDGV